ncbi:proton-conducting transporter transmembrane domain-containing protein [Desulfopila inferna]|uniref:proton-conducting transporter transmembrane domain-containing protein n=1 Tax=Desulfopila inferna TaxID=468528 RepID=UPI0019642A51|nr:proton-conducting transporter membrane subunit [Desulfopila inferna]MBM9605142.1 hydrogenase [Desulfopila inferna]
MDTFLLSLTVIFAGGLFSLLSCRQFSLMKAGYTAITIAGCLIGVYSTIDPLQGTAVAVISIQWLHIFTLSFSIDSLSAFFLIPIFAICPLAVLYSFHYMDKAQQSGRVALSFIFFNLLIISMALVATADNIISFALVWELMSLSSFFLVLHEYQKEETRRAGFIYLIFTQAGAIFIFAAFALAYSHTDTFAFAAFAVIPGNIKLIVFFFALIGFGSKAGIFPLHMWLPHAHPAAPSHISAVMSGVMIKMGIYGIIRLYSLLNVTDIVLGQVVLCFGMISGVLGVVYALGKHDLKKLLAYHSVENIGIILIGAGIGMIGIASDNTLMAAFGFAGSLLHVLNHSIFKSLLFLGAGAVLQKTGTRHLDQLGGLIKTMPTTGRTFLIGSISISGLPPFNGFVSEFLIYFAAFHGLVLHGSSFIFSMLAIISLAIIGGLAAACFTKVIGVVFLGEPRSKAAENARESGPAMTVPMIILAVSCLVIGVFPEPFVGAAFLGLKNIEPLAPVDPQYLAMVTGNLAFVARLFLVVFLGSTLLRNVLYVRKTVVRGPTWGCGFTQPTVRMQYTGTSYAMSVLEFFKPFVRIRTRYSGITRIFPGRTLYETRVDDIAEIVLVDRLTTPVLYLLGKLRWIQHGHIQLYIGYIIVTIIVLLFFI